MTDPLKLIGAIRQGQPDPSVKIFTEGSCYRFFQVLKSVFPDAIAYYDFNHVITKIGNKFYDITGEVEPNEFSREMTAENFSQETLDFYYQHFYNCPVDYNGTEKEHRQEVL